MKFLLVFIVGNLLFFELGYGLQQQQKPNNTDFRMQVAVLGTFTTPNTQGGFTLATVLATE